MYQLITGDFQSLYLLQEGDIRELFSYSFSHTNQPPPPSPGGQKIGSGVCFISNAGADQNGRITQACRIIEPLLLYQDAVSITLPMLQFQYDLSLQIKWLLIK